MAISASKFTNNLNPPARRGQIKINAIKMIAKSLQNLAIEVAGKQKKEACNGGTGGGGGRLKSASESKIKQRKPKRGDVKIKIFKLIAKSVKDFAIWGLAGREKKSAAAGDGGGIGIGGCVSSTMTVIPLEIVGELEPDSEYEIKQNPLWSIEIDIPKMIAGSMLEIPMESTKVAGGVWAGIVPMGLESVNEMRVMEML